MFVTQILPRSTEDSPYMPFLLFDGPSGAGKTQSAFVVRHSATFQKKFWGFYVVFHIGIQSQAIYEAYRNLSDLFSKCVQLDLESLSRRNKNEQVPQCHEIPTNMKFETVTLFCFLIFGHRTAATIDALSAIINAGDRRPIIFLDEIPPIQKNARRVAFVRNLLRLCGIVPVLMGTDSTAVNIIPKKRSILGGFSPGEDVSNSRGSAGPWCYLITQFPSSHPSTEGHPLFRGSNAWISRLVRRPLKSQDIDTKYQVCHFPLNPLHFHSRQLFSGRFPEIYCRVHG